MNKFIKILIIGLLMIILLGCDTTMDSQKTSIYPQVCSEHGCLYYEIVYIEGMPCVNVFGKTTNSGLSCDWSQWEGK